MIEVSRGDPPTYELITVSYRSRQPLSRLLDAVVGVPVIVVDNAAGIDGVGDLTHGRDAVRYIDAGANVGFAAAANLGAAASGADTLIFVNPDCVPRLPVLEELSAYVQSQREVAACAPVLHDVHGRVSRQTGGWAPTVARCLVHALGLHVVLRRGGIWVTVRPGEVVDVGWLAGTCLAVRRDAFESVGGFDESYFLYNEDMALGDRLRRAGMRQVLRGDLAVEHAGGASSAGVPLALWLLRAGSLGRYVQDHNGPAAATCMRAALCAGSLLRAAVFSVSPNRRHRRREMLTYVSGMLRPNRAITVASASVGGAPSRAADLQRGP